MSTQSRPENGRDRCGMEEWVAVGVVMLGGLGVNGCDEVGEREVWAEEEMGGSHLQLGPPVVRSSLAFQIRQERTNTKTSRYVRKHGLPAPHRSLRGRRIWRKIFRQHAWCTFESISMEQYSIALLH